MIDTKQPSSVTPVCSSTSALRPADDHRSPLTPAHHTPAQLTPLNREDAEELFALTHANRDHLRVWLTWVDHVVEPEHTQAFVNDALEQELAGKQKHFLLRLDDAIIGTISLIDIGNGQGTVGYWIAQAHQGKGHVTRGVLQLKTTAFEALGLDCLHLEYFEGNEASARVAAKCGFVFDRMIERGAVLYGRELDRICCVARKPTPSA